MSSSSSSSNKILMEIDIDALANKLTETHIEDSSPSSSQNPKNYFLVLPAELIEKVFAEIDDHDTFQKLVFLSKHMHFIVKPYLMAKRRHILDKLCNFRRGPSNMTNLELCKELIRREEKYLGRVLRTNQELTCSAHNLPIERVQQQAHDQLISAEQRAYQLLRIALENCHAFSRFYHVVIVPFMKGMKYHHRMNKNSFKAFNAGIAYRFFEEFLHENPVLSMFTDVHWPEEMPEGTRRQMALQYAKQIAKNPDNLDIKCRIQISGGIGNPSKPLRIRHSFHRHVRFRL